ncbi:MAG: protein mraZ [Bacteroidales bacterium]|nr:protein mraZ [Bacteroidales bacterium]
MANFIGDFTAKIDSKGRVNFPSAYIKQMSESSEKKFVIKKDIYDKCLIIYTSDEWDRQTSIINKKTNPYNKKHSAFLREFYRGTAELKLDSNNRILIPSRLLEEINIKKDIKLLAQNQKIELWAIEEYEKVAMEANDFANLAEEIMGGDLPEL